MIKIFTLYIILFSFVFSSDNLLLLEKMNENSEWLYDCEDEGIKVSVLNNDSLPPVIKLEKIMLNTDGILDVILNVKNYNNVLTERTLTSKYITQIADTTYGYQITKNFIPFTRNRHLIFKMYKTEKNRIDWILLDKEHPYFDPYRSRRTKELPYGAGAWEIKELDDGDYKLIHYLYIDPLINMPRFFLNSATKRSVLKVFKDVLNSYNKIK